MIVGGIQFRIDKCTHAQIHQLLLVVLCACVRAIVITTKYFGPLNAIIQFIALHWSLLHFIFNRDESFEIASIRYWDTHTHTHCIYMYMHFINIRLRLRQWAHFCQPTSRLEHENVIHFRDQSTIKQMFYYSAISCETKCHRVSGLKFCIDAQIKATQKQANKIDTQKPWSTKRNNQKKTKKKKKMNNNDIKLRMSAHSNRYVWNMNSQPNRIESTEWMCVHVRAYSR